MYKDSYLLFSLPRRLLNNAGNIFSHNSNRLIVYVLKTKQNN